MPDIPVTIRRRRAGRTESRHELRGFLRALPQVGAPLVAYVPRNDGSLDRLVTSTAQRVLMDANGRVVFVSTRRSCYVVRLDEPVVALPPPIRGADSFDAGEMTQHPQGFASMEAEGADDADADSSD